MVDQKKLSQTPKAAEASVKTPLKLKLKIKKSTKPALRSESAEGDLRPYAKENLNPKRSDTSLMKLNNQNQKPFSEQQILFLEEL